MRKRIKIALVHDHLAQDGGAEKVLKVFKEMYPEAPIFTLIFDPENTNDFFRDKDIRTSFLQRMPLGVSRYQWWVGLMPMATEGYNLMEYDIVLSSASAFAKGIITKPGARHICYCHTPTRYLWTDTHSYVEELKVNKIVKSLLPLTLNRLRLWDMIAVNRVDHFLANSSTVSNRIKKYYNRDSQVVYPPVEVNKFRISNEPKRFFLAGGRLVPYKKFDLLVHAFSRLNIPLKIFGIGPEMKRLEKMAKSNVQFMGKVSEEQKKWLYSNCIAYLNPQDEDFGITTIEAMASGRPVIAYRAGGATETVIEGVTGEFFDRQWWEEIADKAIRFKEGDYKPEAIKAHADQFSEDRFKSQIRNVVDDCMNSL